MQDLGFTDGLIGFASPDISAISSTAPVLTRAAAGDVSWVAQASATTYFEVNVLDTIERRSGFSEDTQNVFGSTFGSGVGGFSAGPSGLPGTGIPGSAEPQGRPGNAALGDGFILPAATVTGAQPASGMATLQELTPRGALKLKGIKPLSLTVIGKMITGSPTSINCSLTLVTLKNGSTISAGSTNLLANGFNGLPQTYSSAILQVTVIPIPNAMFYQITPNTQLWFEMIVVEPGSNTYAFYGVELACEFNYN